MAKVQQGFFSFVIFLLIESFMSESYTEKMLSFMDTSVNPCENFYDFSCGHYSEANKLPKAIKTSNIFSVVKDEIIDEMYKIFTEEDSSNIQNDALFNKTKTIYQACINANLFEYKKSEVYLNLIESLGGWPVLKPDWRADEFDWFQVISILKKYNIEIIFRESVSGSVIGIEPDLFGLTRLNVLDIHRKYSRAFQLNKKLSAKIMKMYGVPSKAAKRAFDEIIEFGKQVTNVERLARIYNEDISTHTIKSLNEFESLSFDWEMYFTGIFESPANTSTEVLVKSKEFFEYIPMAFRQKYLRGAANYIFLKMLYLLHDEFRYPKYPKRFCFFYIDEFMKSFLNVFYLRSKYYRRSTKNEVGILLTNIQSAFRETISSSDWMDDSTKVRALAKLEMMKILYNDEEAYSVDMNEIDKKCCKDLDVNFDDFFGNHLKIQRLEKKINHRHFIASTEADISNIELIPLKVNAFYSSRNIVYIFPPILRPPFYNKNLPMIYNFASIGRILGHEITHGFDYDGRKLDGNGIMTDWWSPESSVQFEEKAKCFRDQYNGFKLPELNERVNGTTTLAENIADNGGLRQAFKGFQKWLMYHQNESHEQLMLGHNFTQMQTFFIVYGQTFCEKLDWNGHKGSLDEEHAPNRFRLIGTLQNFDEFQTAFNCKLGTLMNPVKKCVLW